MKPFRSLLLVSVAIVATTAFTSCDQEPYYITQNEEYTKNFIKTFGLIDPNQDWNMAEEATVSVNVGNHANSVRIYSKVGMKYFLVANLTNMRGSFVVPVDIPEGCNDLMVNVDGKQYYTTRGGNVEASVRIASRAVGTEGGIATVTVTDPLIFNIMQVSPIIKAWAKDADGNFDPATKWLDYTNSDGELRQNLFGDQDPLAYGLIPERTSTNGVGDANYHNPYVAKDFWFSGVGSDGITIYPMFWNTNVNYHEIGIYYFADADGQYVAPGTPESHIVHERIFNDKNNDPTGQLQVSDLNISKWIGLVKASYSDELKTAFNNVIKTDGTYPELSTFTQDNLVTNKTIKDALINVYKTKVGTQITYDYNGISKTVSIDDLRAIDIKIWGYNTTNGITDADIVFYPLEFKGTESGTDPYTNAPYQPDQDRLASAKGINIKVPSDLIFGFYLSRNGDGLYFHSQSRYNTTAYGCDSNDAVQNQPFACTFKHQVSGNQFFSFEDASWSTGEWDLNDLVFRLNGTVTTFTEDDNTILDWVNKTTTVTDDVISWIVAAEDLGSTDDFDFNDVIFSIQSITTNTTETTETGSTDGNGNTTGDTESNSSIYKKVTIQALASGGILPVWLHYNNGTTDYILGPNGIVETNSISAGDADDYEWHRWFGGRTSGQMINTGRVTVAKPSSLVLSTTGSESVATGADNILSSIENGILDKDFTVATYSVTNTIGNINTIKGFYITVNEPKVTDTDEMTDVDATDYRAIGAPTTGAAPQMFLIPDEGAVSGTGWLWPTERTHIMEAYPTFQSWVQNKSEGAKWYKHPNTGVSRPADIGGMSSSSSSSSENSGSSTSGGSSSSSGTNPPADDNAISLTYDDNFTSSWGGVYPVIKISPTNANKSFGNGTVLTFTATNNNFAIFTSHPGKGGTQVGKDNISSPFTLPDISPTHELWIVCYQGSDQISGVTATNLVDTPSTGIKRRK